MCSIKLTEPSDTGQLSHSVSISGTQLEVFQASFWVLTIIALVWLFTIGAVLFSMGAFNTGVLESASVANGAIYMSAFAMALIVNVAIVAPALLMLQPFHLWRVLREEKTAVTPRQRFRGKRVRNTGGWCTRLTYVPQRCTPEAITLSTPSRAA